MTVPESRPLADRMRPRSLTEVQTLRADFTQSVVDADGETLQQVSGTLAVRKPGRFRWDYREPFVQVIVADGEDLWMYDEELAQVTVRPLDSTLALTPAMLLSGSGDLRAHSDVITLDDASGLAWVGLVPHQSDTEFEAVRIGFRGDELAVMELVDGFGQTTRIEFTRVARNVEIDDGVFRFVPPPGADVIR
ncbi:MAG: outer membrane lipoprotein chaperone LolA [Gammaproteobacteria bacterium]